LGVNFLFALGFVAAVGFRDHVEALAEAVAGCGLLGVGEELVGLGADFAAFVVGELFAHFLDEDKEGAARAFAVAAAFGDASGPFQDRFGVLAAAEAAKNESLGGKRLSEKDVLATAFEGVDGEFNGALRKLVLL
jgi:hypothetical protein